MPVNPWVEQLSDPFEQQDETQAGPSVQLPGWGDYQFGPGWTGANNPPSPTFGGGGGGGAAGGGGTLPSSQIGTGAVNGLMDMGAVGGGVGGTATGAGIGSTLLDLLIKLGPIGAGLIGQLASGGFGGGSGGGSGGPAGQMSPEMEQLLALAMKRMTAQEPLFQSVTNQAMQGLPTYAQQGG